MLCQHLDFALSAIQKGLSLLHARCAALSITWQQAWTLTARMAAVPSRWHPMPLGAHACPCCCFSMLQARCSTAYYYGDVSAGQLRDAGSSGRCRRVYRTIRWELILELSRHS